MDESLYLLYLYLYFILLKEIYAIFIIFKFSNMSLRYKVHLKPIILDTNVFIKLNIRNADIKKKSNTIHNICN